MVPLHLKKIILLIGDAVLLYVSLYITLRIRYFTNFESGIWFRHLLPFSLLFFIWIVVFFINNLYALQNTRNDFKFYSYLIQNLLINTLVGFSFFYLAPVSITTSLRPFRVLLVVIIIYALLFLLWRRLFYSLTSSETLTNNTLFIGVSDEAAELVIYMRQNPQLGYTLAAIINPENIQIPNSISSVPCVKDFTRMRELIKEHGIQTVVTVGDTQHNAHVLRYLFETLDLGLTYRTFPAFYEELTGRIPVASLQREWFLENLLSGKKIWYEVGKRLSDIIIVLVFTLMIILFIPFIMLGIKLSSPGPILFLQRRVGKDAKEFTAMKFRTMIIDAEKNGAQWAVKNDPRVTRFGKFLRKTRLDEIPQFINIIRGEMSLVGPRPERPEFVSTLTENIPFYRERLLVKPGLSGWAQINYKYGESVDDAMRKLQYDLFYIKNRSFALDLSIILKTLNAILNANLGQ